MRCVAAFAALAVALASAASAQEPAAPAPPAERATPEALLQAAFANRYEVDAIYEMELILRDRGGHEQRRRLHTVSKRVDGRSQSMGRVTDPASLRGTSVLILEADGGRLDMFVYLPALRRARRVSSSQRMDAFLGSDLTYEDFERQRAADFAVEALPDEQVAGETCRMLRATPKDERAYSAVVFAVAESDRAILEYRYFESGATSPYRIISTPRSAMRERSGHLLPTRFEVRNLERGTSTDLAILELAVDRPIDDRLFSVRALEQRMELPSAAD
jgi:hypothetical protein